MSIDRPVLANEAVPVDHPCDFSGIVANRNEAEVEPLGRNAPSQLDYIVGW
jgi:hypothetical protein